jgi:hypothetical protein
MQFMFALSNKETKCFWGIICHVNLLLNGLSNTKQLQIYMDIDNYFIDYHLLSERLELQQQFSLTYHFKCNKRQFRKLMLNKTKAIKSIFEFLDTFLYLDT